MGGWEHTRRSLLDKRKEHSLPVCHLILHQTRLLHPAGSLQLPLKRTEQLAGTSISTKPDVDRNKNLQSYPASGMLHLPHSRTVFHKPRCNQKSLGFVHLFISCRQWPVESPLVRVPTPTGGKWEGKREGEACLLGYSTSRLPHVAAGVHLEGRGRNPSWMVQITQSDQGNRRNS